MAERGGAGRSSCGEMLRDFIIDFVNPKFRFYSRPLMLALVIGSLTFVGMLVIYFPMLHQCTTHTEYILDSRIIATEKGYQGWVSTKAGFECLDVALLITPVGNRMCRPGARSEVIFCESLPAYYVTLREEFREDPYTERASESLTTCLDALDSVMKDKMKEGHVKETPGLMTFKTCPGAVSTLGAAMGYMGFIELFLTVCVVSILVQCKCLKGKDGSMMKDWITQLMTVSNGTQVEQIGGSFVPAMKLP